MQASLVCECQVKSILFGPAVFLTHAKRYRRAVVKAKAVSQLARHSVASFSTDRKFVIHRYLNNAEVGCVRQQATHGALTHAKRCRDRPQAAMVQPIFTCDFSDDTGSFDFSVDRVIDVRPSVFERPFLLHHSPSSPPIEARSARSSSAMRSGFLGHE
jgi:hypothetical protein